MHNTYDLVVTVCDNAKETCPMFPRKVKTIHISFEDPDGKGYKAFEDTLNEIRTVLLARVKKELS